MLSRCHAMPCCALCRAGLKTLFEEKGPGYVVTAEDVKAISDQASQRKRFKGGADGFAP